MRKIVFIFILLCVLKIEAQVRTADGVLVADCEIGTDLHKLYVARTLLLAARALPLVRPDLQRQK